MPYSCPVCNNEDYDEHDGLFFCTVCGTQSQELIVQETETILDINTRHEIKISKASKESTKTKTDLGRPWTIYEAYQTIILAQTDALIKLVGKEELKDTVFTIWSNYLAKLGVAFCFPEKLVPDIVIQTRIGRVRELHRGTLNNPLNRKKRPFRDALQAKISKESGMSEVEFYEEDQPIDEAHDNIVFLDEEAEACQYLEDGTKNNTRFRVKRCEALRSPEWMDMKKTLAICFIGLMVTQVDILPYDVVKWAYEGKVPFLSTTHLLPPDMVLSGGDRRLFEVGAFNTTIFIAEINRLLIYLKMNHMPSPNLCGLICRFVKELSLPDELAAFACKLTVRIPFAPNRKGRQDMLAMSYIILGMKVIFGLDDASERLLSTYSQKVQNLFKSDIDVFVWRDWKNFTIQKLSHQFNAFTELTSDLSKSKLQHLDKLLAIYTITSRDKKKITTNFTLNRRRNAVQRYQTDFREALRKPLEIASERWLSSEPGRQNMERTREQEYRELSDKFYNSTLCHLTDLAGFKKKIGHIITSEQDKEFRNLSEQFSVPRSQVFQYKYLRNKNALLSSRHENYMWLLDLAYHTIDCKIFYLDKLVVRLTDYLVAAASEKDMSLMVCTTEGIKETSDGIIGKKRKINRK